MHHERDQFSFRLWLGRASKIGGTRWLQGRKGWHRPILQWLHALGFDVPCRLDAQGDFGKCTSRRLCSSHCGSATSPSAINGANSTKPGIGRRAACRISRPQSVWWTTRSDVDRLRLTPRAHRRWSPSARSFPCNPTSPVRGGAGGRRFPLRRLPNLRRRHCAGPLRR